MTVRWITEWIMGKCIERQYDTRNEILRFLTTGKEKHIQHLMTTVARPSYKR